MDVYVMARIKRSWIPELIFTMFRWLVPFWPFKQLLTRETTDAEKAGSFDP